MAKIYKDPKRKHGSQKEVPSINSKNDKVIVGGYQEFMIDKNTRKLTFKKKQKKFSYINNILYNLNRNNKLKSFVDLGCNSGLTSFIALNNNFQNIVSLDHDAEYINIITKIKKECNISNINESVFSFGNKINETFDVVFCGAIIHWIFSLTADFRNFDNIMDYLIPLSNNYLIIEWISENDSCIVKFNHIKKRYKDGDADYNTENFEKSILKYSKIISKVKGENNTRIFYILKKNII